jgi:hypothetical protein
MRITLLAVDPIVQGFSDGRAIGIAGSVTALLRELDLDDAEISDEE